ncbi:hypothetical protein L0663_04985 [Dyadobacter sp. CY107]|uniref:hypothetical protein n=1 Tax=Dyadobacter fanqingshengii TaxID=2906443 RepID=UPI001F2104B1|nr:hypothetical protein [Dyadobacter fanqingshengii]MCF2502721.1 hypothetical protein [Dyadobacter fanqingshengii]
MSQLSALFQTLGAITQLSDKITTLLIAVIAFFLLDKQFQFSENYRKNELHGRLISLLTVSYAGNDTSKRGPSGATLDILESQLRSLKTEISSVKSSNIAELSQTSFGCSECVRVRHSVLTVLTSGFWFFLYGFASFFYIFIRKMTAVKQGEPPMSWSSAGIAALTVVALLGPFILLVTGFAASLPVFYSPIFNYALNIAISGFWLQAVAKVFGSFFVGAAAPAPVGELQTDDQGASNVSGFWPKFRWLFGISNKK